MEERKSIRHIPPMVHEGCGGVFIFSQPRDNLIPNERVCNECGRKETYELNQAIIIGMPGVTVEYLSNLFKSAGLTILDAKVDKSNPKICALFISVPDEILKDHLGEFELWAHAVEKNKSYVRAVLRKPLAISVGGMKISYI